MKPSNMMDIWYTENHTDHVRMSMRVDKQLASVQSDFQRIDIFESVEFGRIMTLDGLLMLTEKDEYIYHEMITHIPMATNPNIRNILVIGAGDGGTVRELVRYPSIEHIDVAEIDEMVVELSKKYQEKDAAGYSATLEKAGKVFQKNPLFMAKNLMLKGEDEAAVRLLENDTEKLPYYEVTRRFLLGVCYYRIGKEEQGKECMEYVIGHGNTLKCKEEAEKYVTV